jgi:hypothetical protein
MLSYRIRYRHELRTILQPIHPTHTCLSLNVEPDGKKTKHFPATRRWRYPMQKIALTQ